MEMSERQRLDMIEASKRRLQHSRNYENELAISRCDMYNECIKKRKQEKLNQMKILEVERVENAIKVNSEQLLQAVADIGRAHREAEEALLQSRVAHKRETVERRHLKGRINNRTQIAAKKVREAEMELQANQDYAEKLISVRRNEIKASREDAQAHAATLRNDVEKYQPVVIERHLPPPIRSAGLITIDHMRRTKGPLPVESDIRVIRHFMPKERAYVPLSNVTIDTENTISNKSADEEMKGLKKLFNKVIAEMQSKWIIKARNRSAKTTLYEVAALAKFELSLKALSALDSAHERTVRRVNTIEMIPAANNSIHLEQQFESIFVHPSAESPKADRLSPAPDKRMTTPIPVSRPLSPSPARTERNGDNVTESTMKWKVFKEDDNLPTVTVMESGHINIPDRRDSSAIMEVNSGDSEIEANSVEDDDEDYDKDDQEQDWNGPSDQQLFNQTGQWRISEDGNMDRISNNNHDFDIRHETRDNHFVAAMDEANMDYENDLLSSLYPPHSTTAPLPHIPKSAGLSLDLDDFMFELDDNYKNEIMLANASLMNESTEQGYDPDETINLMNPPYSNSVNYTTNSVASSTQAAEYFQNLSVNEPEGSEEEEEPIQNLYQPVPYTVPTSYALQSLQEEIAKIEHSYPNIMGSSESARVPLKPAPASVVGKSVPSSGSNTLPANDLGQHVKAKLSAIAKPSMSAGQSLAAAIASSTLAPKKEVPAKNRVPVQYKGLQPVKPGSSSSDTDTKPPIPTRQKPQVAPIRPVVGKKSEKSPTKAAAVTREVSKVSPTRSANNFNRITAISASSLPIHTVSTPIANSVRLNRQIEEEKLDVLHLLHHQNIHAVAGSERSNQSDHLSFTSETSADRIINRSIADSGSLPSDTSSHAIMNDSSESNVSTYEKDFLATTTSSVVPESDLDKSSSTPTFSSSSSVFSSSNSSKLSKASTFSMEELAEFQNKSKSIQAEWENKLLQTANAVESTPSRAMQSLMDELNALNDDSNIDLMHGEDDADEVNSLEYLGIEEGDSESMLHENELDGDAILSISNTTTSKNDLKWNQLRKSSTTISSVVDFGLDYSTNSSVGTSQVLSTRTGDNSNSMLNQSGSRANNQSSLNISSNSNPSWLLFVNDAEGSVNVGDQSTEGSV